MSNQSVINQLVQYESYLIRLAYRFTKNENDAKDLLQATMCRCIEKVNYFKEGTNLKSWISTVMKNLFINGYRRKKKKQTIALENYQDLDITPSRAEFNLFQEEIKSLIDKLDHKYKEVLKFTYQGYSYQEIADKLNLPIGTVKSRIHFMRKVLRENLNNIQHSSNGYYRN